MNRLGLGVFAMVLVSAACTDNRELMAPKLSLNLAEGGSKNYFVVFNQPSGLPTNVDRLVAAAGGTVTARMKEIGSIGASSSDPDFVAKMKAQSHVKEVGEDIEFQMIPPSG